MKNLYKNILSVSLLLCFALSASAQVTQIWNNDGSLHKVKIDNDKISVTISNKKHDVKQANEIIRKIQEQYTNKMYITVKFQ
jgi:hypothetical protein